MYDQRDVGENEFKNYPAIIVSNDLIYETEGKYYAVMLSTKVYDLPTEYHLNPMILPTRPTGSALQNAI